MFSTKHKKGIENVAVDAFSRRYALVSVLGAKLLGLQAMQAYYLEDQACQDLVKNTPAQGPYMM